MHTHYCLVHTHNCECGISQYFPNVTESPLTFTRYSVSLYPRTRRPQHLQQLPPLLSGSVPSSLIYSHHAVSGKLIRMLSIRAPGVINPNFAPRS